MTLAFVNTYTDAAAYANAAALTAVVTTAYTNGTVVEVTGIGAFKLNMASTAAVDNTTVIAATLGNWEIFTPASLMVNSLDVIDASRIPWGSVTSPILAPAGTALLPGLAISTATNGFYAPAANQVALALNAANVITYTATAFVSATAVQYSAGVGSAAAPSYSFTGDLDTGLYHVSANTLGLTCNGAVVLSIASTAVTVASGAQFVMPASTAAAPAFTLGGEQTGLYLVGAGSMGLSVAGVIKTNLTATALNMASGVALQIATVQVVGARNTGWTTFAGTGTKNQSAINVDTFTATDANIRLLGQGVKGILDALILHGLVGA